MKNTRKQNIFVLTTLAAAMTGVFAAMPAYADDEERAALTQPQNSVDAEVITVSQGSPQFGQYNGLNRKGAYGNANIQFRAGDAYTDNENGGTTRVTIIGTDLGLSDRSASAKYENQGSWSVGIGYDALTHVIGTANGYQTPYGNGVGQNRFTLPSTFSPVSTAATNNNGAPNPSAAYMAGTQNLSPSQLGSFGPQTIQTTRDTYSVNGSYIFDSQLTGSFDVSHMVQSGAKLTSFATGKMNALSTTQTGVVILPNPTNYQTDTANAGLEWKGEGYRLGLNYFGSFFRNAYDLSGLQVQVPWVTGLSTPYMNTLSTMPNNMMNQVALSGGYDFTSKTKLNGSLSWGLNTSSPGYAMDPNMAQSPIPDFNGTVTQLHGDLKLIDRSVKDLTLSAGAKIDERNNNSSSSTNAFPSYSGTAYTNVGPNAPVSWRKGIVELAADYKIDKNNAVDLSYQNTQMRRWCNNYAAGGLAAQPYPAGTACVASNSDSTNAIDLGYKLKASESLSFKLGAGYSSRVANWNPNAIGIASDQANPNTINPFYLLPNFTPGQNGQNFMGFYPYFAASQQVAKIKGSANWQATDRLGFYLSGQLTNTNYPDNKYGMQNAYGWSLNLDGSYNWSETGMVHAYVTQQQGTRVYQNLYGGNGSTQALGTFTNTMNEMTTTVGLGAAEKGLMGSRLTVTGDALFSFANTQYQDSVQWNAASSICPGTTAGNPCGNVSPIANNLMQLKTSGIYQVDKHSKLGLSYMYQHLYSNDFYYNGMQVGNTPTTLLPTMQSNPSYSVNLVQAKYIYDF